MTTNLLCPKEETEDNFSLPPTNRIQRKFLRRITLTRNGQVVSFVDFSSSPGRQDSEFSEDRMLNQIKAYSVLNGDTTPIKRYSLTLNYFANNNNVFQKKRLKLDAVQELDPITGATTKPAYEFTYNTSIPFADRYTAKIDHWGFFNNSSNTNSIVPNFTVSGFAGRTVTFGGGANREPSLDGSSCNMLTRIKYPTGGYSDFEYELNQAVSGGIVQNIGGIRVKSISDYSFSGQLATKKAYSYMLDNGQSSGTSSIPVYLKTTSRMDYHAPPFGSTDPCRDYDKPWTIYTISANSIFGLGTVQGSHIGYSQVSETLTDPSNRTTGRTVYHYNIGTFSERDDDIRNGDLLKTSYYDNEGKVLKEVTNTYQYGVTTGMSGYVYKPEDYQTNKNNYCRSNANVYYNYNEWQTVQSSWGCVETRNIPVMYFLEDYYIPSRYSNLLTTEEKTYDQLTNSFQTASKTYTYGSSELTLPTKISESVVNNAQIVTEKKYAADYNTTGATDPAATAIARLNSINAKGTEIESVQYRQDANGANKRYVAGILTTFSSSTAPKAEKTFLLESDAPLVSLQASNIVSGAFTFDPSYKLRGTYKYDSDGGLIEQTKTGGAPEAFLWDYNSIYPTAKVSNGIAESIAYTSFETASKGNWANVNVSINTSYAFSGKRGATMGTSSLISKSFTAAPQQLLLSYWSRSGPVQVSGNGGSVVSVDKIGATLNGWTYYEYLMPSGTVTVQMKVISGQAVIDEVRLYPVNAVMETFNYTPEIGQNTTVSTSNQATYFDYDSFGRLSFIKNYKNEIVKSFSYNYGPGTSIQTAPATLYYNTAAQQNFTKQGCTAGTPEVVAYKVPYGRYTGATQAAADLLAQQDIASNGQNYANNVGRCLFFNVQKSRKVFKNDCPPDQGVGLFVMYVVPAGTYSATTQAEADSLAVADLDANGQAYANANATCSCSGEGKKMINGNCETGTKIYVSSTANGSGQYTCVYWYRFSDNSYSNQYTTTSATPCVNN